MGHYGDMLQGADNTAIYYLNSMAAHMLRNLQRDLQSLQRQMVIYAGAVNPNSGLEYHTIQANAVQAITVAEIYIHHLADCNQLINLEHNRVHNTRNGSEPRRNSSGPCHNPTRTNGPWQHGQANSVGSDNRHR